MDREGAVYEDRGARWSLTIAGVLCILMLGFFIAIVLETDDLVWPILALILLSWTGWTLIRLALGSCYAAELTADTLVVRQFRRTRHIPLAEVTRIKTRYLGGDYATDASTLYVIEFAGGEAVLDEAKGGREFADALLRVAPTITRKGW